MNIVTIFPTDRIKATLSCERERRSVRGIEEWSLGGHSWAKFVEQSIEKEFEGCDA